MAKKEIKEEIKEIKSKLQAGKLVIGKEQVLKRLGEKSLQKVFLAKNCPQDTIELVLHYAEIAKVPVQTLEQDNEEIGIICKKNFFISTLGIQE